MKIKTHDYDAYEWPFRDAIEMLLGTNMLENLHRMGNAPKATVKPGSDNHTAWHAKFYDNCAASGFMDIYEGFVREFIKPLFGGEALVVQSKPTFRIHWHGNLSVGAFHRDSDYNHLSEEINFWLPVTFAREANSIWIESERGKGDYTPQTVLEGQVLEFPGSELMHGNKINETGDTRVSFDFRVIPQSKYIEPAEPKAGLGHGLKRFVVGEYYKLF